MVELKVEKNSFSLTGSVREVRQILKLLACSRLTVAQWLKRANPPQ